MSDELINSQIRMEGELDRRILHALETAPKVEIPADFAARVAGRLPARRPVSLTATHYGRNALFLGLILTLAVLVAVTLHDGSRATFGLAEAVLLTEFLALTVWLTVRRHGIE